MYVYEFRIIQYKIQTFMKTKILLMTFALIFSSFCRAKGNQADTTSVVKNESDTIITGFRCILSGEVGPVLSNGSIFGADLILGHQETPHSFVGGGIGIVKYYNEITLIAPVFIYARLNTTNTKNPIFADLKAGYTLGARLYVNPSIGIRFGNKIDALNLAIGYRYQGGLQYVNWSNNSYESSSYIQSSIEFRVGYEF